MTPASEKRKLSKTPSWIMVGFVLGVLAVLAFQSELQRRERNTESPASPPPAAPERPPPAPNVTALPGQPSLAAIEAVLAEFRDVALWEDDLTEVALWNSATNAFSDHFEVLRTDSDTLYFRSIPQFTRLPLGSDYGPPGCPLRFTETAAMRAEREARRKAAAPMSP